ncbi:MAG: ribosome small subunit-dependent GTPase A [Halioglobus sp.]
MPAPTTVTTYTLAELGWNNFFLQQLSLEELASCQPARVAQQHKSELQVLTEAGELTVRTPLLSESRLTVGDWLLLDDNSGVHRLLERATVFSRKAAGSKVDEQLIAANVDTLFIVCSMNKDFNLNRIERYLVLANDAGVEPLVLLTKADLCENQESVDNFVDQVQALDPFLTVIALNALDDEQKTKLAPWCKTGKTLAFLGSSGVGKSTLVNTLLGSGKQSTGGIREDDSKGHHTTTSRSLHVIPSDEILAGIVLDTPGMRELQLANSEEGIEETFADIMQLATQCRFGDCDHDSEPGCAVQAAIGTDELPLRRLQSFQKLQREDLRNSASLAEKRESDKKLQKYYSSVQASSRRLKNR